MRQLVRILIFGSVGFCLSTLSMSTLAADDLERRELSRLLREIKHLDAIILVARSSSESGSGVRFDYDAMERDLHLIKQGIADHLNAVVREPRFLPKIQADYRIHGD